MHILPTDLEHDLRKLIKCRPCAECIVTKFMVFHLAQCTWVYKYVGLGVWASIACAFVFDPVAY